MDAAVVTEGRTALVWGSRPAAISVGFEREPLWPGDSGYSVIFSDSPLPRDVRPGDPRVSLVHLDCLLTEHPELAHGVAIAGEYGVADRGDDGVWVVGDLSRLERD